ncbi:hypothetical protein [Mucilaginibacter polytrichastri]|uniref:Glycosyltransferase RgtA/B/C/D-like domain-containing protein n=1 Tax=Mucilaginibacter polytrichastri TaxID=1302689 RepID=A0A1Q6A1B9_9SPHI|nr:hypothetical protein [Mucilaginibacter polytrichastri]OKS87803.1 hypothetical protein RG47T_3265 [Mucilaginibacter polytrichastri]SFT26884.1 hypothetical protein SAMN04487890_12638 [Mucilaginibacter polytrichastri]
MAFPKQLPKIIFILLIVLTAIAGYAIFRHPMAIFPDPSWGFQVMRSMQHGGGFNMKIIPDQGNIAHNYSEFLSWWSPGQYLAPYFFINIFHVNVGQACALTILTCEIVGLFGFYQFFKKAGFSANISAISIAFMACQMFYVVPFVFYNGGEVLLFAFGGWFLYCCLSFNRVKDWRLILFILLSGWIGFICKSSFMWFYAAGLCIIWIRVSRTHTILGKWIVNGLWIGVPAVASFAGIYVTYLSRGYNPTSGGNGLKLLWETFGFPLASPLLSGFSVDDLTHGLLYHPDGPMFSYAISVFIIVALAIATVFIVIRILKTVPYTEYKLVLSVVYIVSVLFFGMAFLRQLAISYEGRHFRMVGLVFIPGAVYLVSRLQVGYRVMFALVWMGITYASLQYVINGYITNRDQGSHGTSGITQQFLDQAGINEVTKLDNSHTNAVFVFLSPDLALEVRNNRFITLDPIDQTMKINYEDYQHCGHSGPLHIFLPSNYKGAKAAMILKSFEDYKGFKLTQLSLDYVMYSAD